jgi:phage-related protein
MAYLPPVVIQVAWDDASILAGIDRDKAALADMAASGDASLVAFSDGAGDSMHDAADDVHDGATRMGEDFSDLGDAAVLGGTAARAGMEDARDAVDDAEQDAETKSGGFSSRIAKVFQDVGTSMGNWGIPFHGSVSKMGDDIERAGAEGDGFMASMISIGKVATIVGGVALAGFAVHAVKTADDFDVSSTRMKTAIQATGTSFASVSPQVEKTYTSMENFGFKNEQTAKTLTELTVATQSPTKAMGDMGLAANLARMKSISLSEAGQVLAKVYAGSNRALTQMGINLNIGSAKLASVQTASEGVSKAQTALKTVQDEVAEGTLKGAKASDKLKAAHETLSAAEDKLKKDQGAVATVMAALEKRTQGQAKAFSGTLAGSMDVLGAHTNHLSIMFGNILMPAVQAAAGVIVGFVTGLAKGEPVMLAIAAIIVGPLVAAVVAFAASMIAANIATLGIGAAFALIIVGIAELIAHWSEVTAFIQSHALIIAAAMAPITGGMSLVVLGAIELASNWQSIWSAISSFTTSIVHTIESTIIAAWNAIKSFTESVWNTIKGFLTSVWNSIKSAISSSAEAVLSVVVSVWNTIRSATTSVWNTVLSAIQAVWSSIKSVVTSTLSAVESVMSSAWSAIQSALSAAWSAIQSTMSAAWSGIASAVSAGIGNVMSFISGLPGKIVGALSGLVGEMERIGSEAIEGLLHGLESAAGSVAGTVSHILSEVNPLSHISIPHLAGGGLVTQPTLAVVGDAGPEAVIPLSQLGGANVLGGSVGALPSGGAAASTPTVSAAPVFNTTIYAANEPTPALINQMYQRLRPLLTGAPAVA